MTSHPTGTSGTSDLEPTTGTVAREVTVVGAAFLGVGAMVGAGIFALLGQAGAIAGPAAWVSFLLAGGVATLLGYVVVKLGVRYPSRGGLVTSIVAAFGNGRLLGITAWLLYLVTILVTAMVAIAFGSYGSPLLFGDDASPATVSFLAVVALIGMAGVNALGARMVARAQSVIVWILLAVFVAFAGVTITHVEWSHLALSGWPSVDRIVAAVAITYFAYLGFTVITYVVEDIEDPARSLPKAMYLALGITTLLYVAVTVGAFGTLGTDGVISAGDTVLAEAARPVLGDSGFTLMAIAALAATAASVNSNLYAAGNLTYGLAGLRQFPPIFGQPGRLGGTRGIEVTVVLTIVFPLLFDLGAIASLGSAVSLVVFLVVGAAAWRVRRETGSNPLVVALAIVASASVLVMFAVDTARDEPRTFTAMLVLVGLAVACDLVWKAVRRPAG